MLLQVGCNNITMRWQQFITPINTKSRSPNIVLYQTLWEQMFMLGSVETSLSLLNSSCILQLLHWLNYFCDTDIYFTTTILTIIYLQD